VDPKPPAVGREDDSRCSQRQAILGRVRYWFGASKARALLALAATDLLSPAGTACLGQRWLTDVTRVHMGERAVPVREGPPQPVPPPKQGPSRIPVRQTDRMGIWTGVAVIAFVVLLGIVLIAPGREEPQKPPSQRVEKTIPAPNSTPNTKP
jgi:hypothetical protein